MRTGGAMGAGSRTVTGGVTASATTGAGTCAAGQAPGAVDAWNCSPSPEITMGGASFGLSSIPSRIFANFHDPSPQHGQWGAFAAATWLQHWQVFMVFRGAVITLG